MSDALQYGALGVLALVLAGAGLGIKSFLLPVLTEQLALMRAMREVLPRMGTNVSRMAKLAEDAHERDERLMELANAVAQDVHWVCGVIPTLVTKVEALEIAVAAARNGDATEQS